MLFETLKTVLSVYGPSGDEGKVASAVKKLLAGSVDSAKIDVMGNLIMEKKGQPGGKTILLSAHMDQIGYVVTAVEKEGFLRVTNVGGVSMNMSRTRHVVFGNGVQGVVACQPVKEGENAAMQHLYVDIGAADEEDARKRVSVGDVCVYAPDVFQMGAHQVCSPAMDDRCACALLCEAMLQIKSPKNTVVALFSTQEEVGLRGANAAAYTVNPDLGVGLDVTAWGDTPETKIPAIELGKGAAVKFMDRSMIATPVVRDALISAAEKAKVPFQREVLPFGGTDGGAIQHTRGGVPAGTLSIPCRNVHSPCEVIDMRDMESALEILKVFVNMDF